MVFSHVPVLYEEAMEYLNIRPDGIYADGTLGGAGHSQGICGRLDERGTLIGIDRDSEAISAAKERLRGFPCRCLFVHSNYSDIKKILRECGVGRIDGSFAGSGRFLPPARYEGTGFFLYAVRTSRYEDGSGVFLFGL